MQLHDVRWTDSRFIMTQARCTYLNQPMSGSSLMLHAWQRFQFADLQIRAFAHSQSLRVSTAVDCQSTGGTEQTHGQKCLHLAFRHKGDHQRRRYLLELVPSSNLCEEIAGQLGHVCQRHFILAIDPGHRFDTSSRLQARIQRSWKRPHKSC